MAQTIKVSISPKGAVEIEVQGIKGAGCQDLTRELERALGQTQRIRETEEFYEQGEAEHAGIGNV